MTVTTTKAMVEEVLTAEGYADKRAAKMEQNDFLCLHLLSAALVEYPPRPYNACLAPYRPDEV